MFGPFRLHTITAIINQYVKYAFWEFCDEFECL